METKRAEMMARDLMGHHGLLNTTINWGKEYAVTPWAFKFDKALTRMGVTNFRKRTIGLSAAAVTLNNEEEILNTILHEIAHALVGPAHGHNLTWYAKAKEIGCDGSRCATNVIQKQGNYALKCKGCSKEIKKYYRRPTDKRVASAYHSICGAHNGRLELVVKGAH